MMTKNNSKTDIVLERLMSLHPKIIDLTLDRVWRLLDRLGNPQEKLPPVIHIAGTNGKGSTLAMIRAGLEAAGKQTHAYTSPHLVRFHERIRLNGELISEPGLLALLEECEEANGGEPITFFEITTVAGLLAFSRSPADYTLLEVGLGGRLDATNVLKPALSVITPVSIDHVQYLGETIEEIAAEKAGIIKKDVPVAVGPQDARAMTVIENEAKRFNAPLIACGQHWMAWEEHGRMVFQDETGLLDLPLPNLIGAHQITNAGLAIASLKHLGFSDEICQKAITQAEWPARMQRLEHGPLTDILDGKGELWLDGGHNAAAGEVLAKAIKQLPQMPTYLICGMLNTKDIENFLMPLKTISNDLMALSIEGETAALDPEEIAQIAGQIGFSTKIAPSIEAALEMHKHIKPPFRVFICGSLYLAGRILQKNETC